MKTKNHFVIVSLFRDKPVKTTLERHVFSIVQLETEEHLKYKVNVHYWDFICGFNVENLRSHPLFPFSPYRRDTTNDLFIRQTDVKFGARVFGYIHPNETGLFKFAISSDDCSEIWLSQDEDPLHVQLIGSVGRTTGKEWSYIDQFDKYIEQKSRDIFLQKDRKYFFDILWKQERGRTHLQVAWMTPTSRQFETITSKFLSKYYDDSDMENGLVYLDHLKFDFRQQDLPSHVKQIEKMKERILHSNTALFTRDSRDFLSLPRVEFSEVREALLSKTYKPSWLIKRNSSEAKNLGTYGAVHLPHYYNITTKIFPKDETWAHTKECVGESLKPMHCEGNMLATDETAQWVTGKYMNALKLAYAKRYVLVKLVNMVEENDEPKGDRYLLELVVKDNYLKILRRLSVYLFRPVHTSSLYYPKKFQWKNNAMVNLIVSVKNQGFWVHQYIQSISKIYLQTNDTRFNLILTDFESFDVDAEEVLRRSPLPHWKVIRKTGRFHKTSAIQEAVSTITDPDSIVLQTDVHLEFPLNFIDDTRKHCVKGKMGYTPLLMRLTCGRSSDKPAGFWEAFGYGIFGLYKSDWDSIGGMDVEKFKNSWGGEDWDFADRVIKNGIEIERLRLPFFFHYFHTRKGMWDAKY